MWSVSQRFLDTLRAPHTVVSTVDVFYGGVLVYSGLPVESGSVTVDEGSQVRRTCSLSISDPSLQPSQVIDMLSPVGTELLVRRGVEFGAGDQELVPLGVFRVRQATRSSWFSGVSITGDDRSKAIADARFLNPWNVPNGYRIVDAVNALIQDAMPGVEFYSIIGDQRIFSSTKAATFDQDRWKAIEDMAAAIGCEVVFDPLGRAVIRVVPSSNGDVYGRSLDKVDSGPVITVPWPVDAGPKGVLIDASVSVSRDGIYNAVVATGQDASQAPVTGYAYLNSGPFAWGGPFGKVPRFFNSQFITSPDMAASAAQSILVRSAGFARTIEPTAIVNPALDVGDLIDIVLPDGDKTRQVVRSLDIPLDPTGTMKIGTRAIDVSTGAAVDGTFS